jgi:hypothetical protein
LGGGGGGGGGGEGASGDALTNEISSEHHIRWGRLQHLGYCITFMTNNIV